MLLWAAFVACTALIVYSGSRLSRYGDILAEKTGLGRAWVGLILMGSVTSLPELVTGVSSVTLAGAPNIAIGDVLGSCVFNMLILSSLDAFYRQAPISTKAHHGHVLSASMGILLLGIVSASILSGVHAPQIGWIGSYSIVFAFIYVLAMRLIFYYEKRHIAAYMKEVAVELKYKDISLRNVLMNYSFNAVLVMVAAIMLPFLGKGIAAQTGLGETFVGNIFIALSTSLPEVVVSITAVRIDAIDLGIGNLFGSNIFNIFILAIDDFFYVDGPLLAVAETGHLIAATSAIMMACIAIIGITYRAERKSLLLAWDSMAIIGVYVINLMLLYMMT